MFSPNISTFEMFGPNISTVEKFQRNFSTIEMFGSGCVELRTFYNDPNSNNFGDISGQYFRSKIRVCFRLFTISVHRSTKSDRGIFLNN